MSKHSLANKLFYLLIILIPTQLGKHFWPSWSYVSGIRFDYLAPTIYLTDVIIAIIAIYFLRDKIKIQNSKFKITPSILNIPKIYWLLAMILGSNLLFAVNPFLAFFKLLKLAELVFIVFYIRNYQPSFKITVYCLLFTVCYSSTIAWLQFYYQSSINGILWFLGERTFNVATPGIARIGLLGRELLRPYATFPHPNVLAGYLVATLPLFVALDLKRYIKLPLILFIIATVTITFSRTAILALLLVGLMYLFTKTLKKFALIFFALLAIILFWIVPAINKDIAFSADSLMIRNELNTAALTMWRDHPLTGVGLNNFLPTLPSYLRIDHFQSFQPVHNVYLLILAEMGIVGAILFLLLIYYIYQMLNAKWQMANNSNQNKTFVIYHSSFIISSCSILFLSLFDHYFFTLQQTQLLVAVILGYIFSFNTAGKHDILNNNV